MGGPTTPVRAAAGLRPDPLPRWRGGRPLKRWRWVGVFADDLLACFGAVSVGGLPQAFWAVWDGRALRERTLFLPGAVRLHDGAVRAPGAALRLEPAGEPVEVRSPHGAQEIWTRKLPVRVRGTVLGHPVDAPGLVDDSAGWHARETTWRWSAGAGVAEGGAPVWWNLVDGVHDAAEASERTVWLDGAAREVGPVPFAGDLSAVGDLRFTAEAERAREDRVGPLRSSYRCPLGSFGGTLPDGTALRSGRGVMEWHAARW